MSNYKLKPTKHFLRKLRILLKKDRSLGGRVKKALRILGIDPFYKGLKTHKVDALSFGLHYSSAVTRDIRIIWDFDEEENIVIILITIGKHSGKHAVYNR